MNCWHDWNNGLYRLPDPGIDAEMQLKNKLIVTGRISVVGHYQEIGIDHDFPIFSAEESNKTKIDLNDVVFWRHV